jgi:hypothetical protein
VSSAAAAAKGRWLVGWWVGWLSNEKENENLQFKQQEETILSMILLTLIDSSSCLRMNLSKLFSLSWMEELPTESVIA